MKTRPSHLRLIQGGAEQLSLKDRLIPTAETRRNVGDTIAGLLGQQNLRVIDNLPVIFRDFDQEHGVVMAQKHPTGNKAILADEKFVTWLVGKGVDEDNAIGYTAHYITALMHIDNALERNERHVPLLRPFGFQQDKWDISHSTHQRAFTARAAATVALTASVDISGDLNCGSLMNQPPHIAAIINPIEEHTYMHLSSVLQ